MRSSKSGGTNALVGNGARTWNCLSPSPSSTPIELMCVAAYLSPGSAENCGDLEWRQHAIRSAHQCGPHPLRVIGIIGSTMLTIHELEPSEMPDFEIQLPALRGIQAGRPFFVALCPTNSSPA